MQRIRLLPVLAAVLLVLASAATAQAGQYRLGYDFASDLSGWSGYVEPGYLLCGHGATADCPDVSTNRILARTGNGQAIWSQGRWEWTAPPGTTIVGGSLAYRTRMLHPQFFARVKMRNDGVTWDAAPTLVNEQQTTALTDHVLPLAGGFRQIGVALYAHPAAAATVTGAWDDYVTLVRLDVTVDDAVAPALAWVDGGGLLDGAWHQGDACATLVLTDGESGAGSVWLASDGATSSWASAGTGSQYQPGPGLASPRLCLAAAALGDGVHAGAVGGSDVSGGQATTLPFTVRVDRTPPGSRLVAPLATAIDARPAVVLDVGDAMSGVTAAEAQIDGAAVPLELSGSRATGLPASALAYGAHALTWAVVDAAGNRSEGSARFDVPDAAAPVLGAPQPPNGAALGADDVLSVAVPVADAASGIDAASAQVLLDGSPIAHVFVSEGVVHAVAGSRLTAGVHHLVLKIADKAGNATRLAWDITVTGAAGSAPAGGGGAAAGTAAGAVPGSPAVRTRKRSVAAVRAVAARVGAGRPRVVIVRLRARPHLRFVLRLRCAGVTRALHLRAGARGIATTRIACAGVATLRLAGARGRMVVHIAARRLPLHLHVRPQSRSAPTVALVSGRLAELRGDTLVLEALTSAGWRRIGSVRADATGRFATSFAIVHAGQFALRGRAPELAGAASRPFVLTMR